MDHILRIDMKALKVSYERTPDQYQMAGGRGLSASILDTEVEAGCDPLGMSNKLIVAPGLLAGTLAPSFGRISFGAKSPLTRGIKEANAGGTAAQKLDRLGIKAIVVEGAPSIKGFWIVKVDETGCDLLPAGELTGTSNYEMVATLKQKFGEKISTISIGPAGEAKMAAATIAVTDRDGRPARHAARGGLGAVMGAKGIKAIVIDDSGVSGINLHTPIAFKAAVKRLVETLKSDENVPLLMSSLGTPGFISAANAVGTMPTRNYTSGSFEHAEALAGDTIKETNAKRGGTMHGCMPGCVIQCSVVYHGKSGKHVTSGLEYETLAMLGSNLQIKDPDMVAQMDRLCDEIGVDTIEIGSALSQAMAAGKLQFGDAQGAISAIAEIQEGTPFGKILGQGTVAVSKEFGLDRVPAVMGQALPAHDARATKATGVTYATSPMGADHTAGTDYQAPYEKEGQVAKSKEAQKLMATFDCVGYCMLAAPTDTASMLPFIADLINARYGSSLLKEDILAMGTDAIRHELAFNQRAGIRIDTVPMPDFIQSESLPPSKSVFDVDPIEIGTIWEDLQ